MNKSALYSQKSGDHGGLTVNTGKSLIVTMLLLLLVTAMLNETIINVAAKNDKNPNVSEQNENGVASVAQEKIQEATDIIQETNQTIQEIKSAGIDVSNAEYILEQATLELNQANLAYENDDFSKAIKHANQAKSQAKKAEKSVQKASDGIQQSSHGKASALQSVANTKYAIFLTNQTIIEAQNLGIDVTDLMSMLNQSILIFSDAVEALNNNDFELALQLTDESKELAEEVKENAENIIEQYEEETSEQAVELAQEALKAAQESITAANETINNLKLLGINVTTAEGLLTQANITLQNAISAFEEENYKVSTSLAEEAKNLAEDARALVEAAQNEQDLPTLEKILETEEIIENVSQRIQGAPQGANMTEATQLLDLASENLLMAKNAFDDGNFTQAEELADISKQQALDAEASAEEAIANFESGAKSEAQEAIQIAESTLSDFELRIQELEVEGYDVAVGKSIFDVANTTLELAKNIFERGFYEEAKEFADTVKELVENGLETLDQLVTSTSSDLDASEDNEGNTLITSSEGYLTMSALAPSIEFNYPVNDTSFDFDVGFMSFIEFIDVNNDNLPQENEILQTLEFEDSAWNKTLQIQSLNGNQEVNIIYSAKAVSYDIILEMVVYEDPTLVSTSLANTTVVFGIDGAAMETKITVIVNDWPWSSNKSQLGLEMIVDVAAEGTVSEKSTQQGNLVQILFNASSAIVKTEWLTKAKVMTPDGFESVVNVETGFELEHKQAATSLKIYFVYPNFEGSKLEHDPNIGLEWLYFPIVFVPILSSLWLSLGSAITVTILAVTVLLISRRRSYYG